MLIAEGVRHLDDEARTALELRAAAQLMTCHVILPGWSAPHDVGAISDEVFDHLVELLADAPCPALDSAGHCVIHRHRPATCRLMGRSWIDPASGDRLDNDCPIQDRFPGYADLPPAPLGLAAMEDALDALDDAASLAGHVTTTVAGAVAAARANRLRPPP